MTKNVPHKFTKPEVMPSDKFVCPPNCLKAKESQFTAVEHKEMQQILI